MDTMKSLSRRGSRGICDLPLFSLLWRKRVFLRGEILVECVEGLVKLW